MSQVLIEELDERVFWELGEQVFKIASGKDRGILVVKSKKLDCKM